MALTLRGTTKTNAPDPTSTLQTALEEFKAALSPEQNLQYDAAAIKPNQSTVVAFALEMDEKISSGANGRCVSSRILTFLTALRQFTDIVGTFVSSNPAIAALVWGSVQTVILLTSNISSFFIKLTELIMEAGRLCPTYDRFASLYQDDTQVQQALCTYYTSVVRLYTKAMREINQNTLPATLSKIVRNFETVFAGASAQLKQDARVVEIECERAHAQRTEQLIQLSSEERDENRLHRILMGKEREEAKASRLRLSRFKANTLREQIRQTLSQVDPEKIFRRIHRQKTPRTAQWFETDVSFTDWRNAAKAALLWCTGKMGSGKSVLMSSIVGHLTATKGDSDIVAHHFCLSGQDDTLKSREIMGSICRQLLDQHISTLPAEELDTLSRRLKHADESGITKLLYERHPPNGTNYILLDGIDECTAEEIQAVVMCLSTLVSNCDRLKIAISGRPEANKAIKQITDARYRMHLSEDKISPDINLFINTELDTRLGRDLTVLDPSIILQIYYKLSGEAQGMFLWVRLFIDDLCLQNSDRDIRNILQSKPPSIAEMIDKKVREAQNHPSFRQTIRILQLCGVLRRPLTCAEFCELLSLRPGQTSRNDDLMIHEADTPVTASYGLLYIDEEERTIHYAHSGVRNHLFEATRYQPEFCATDLDLDLGLLMLTYLNFNNFNRALLKRHPRAKMQPNPLDIAATSIIPPGHSRSTKYAKTILRKWTESKETKEEDLDNAVQRAKEGYQELDQVELQFPLLRYACTYWIDHLDSLVPDSNLRLWTLLSKIVQGRDILAERPWLNSDENTHSEPSFDSQNVLEWAMSNRKPGLIMYVLTRHIAEFSEERKQKILEEAATDLLSCIILALTRTGAVSECVQRTAYRRATACGNIEFVALCIQRFPPTPHEAHYPKVLILAAAGGHVEIAKLLLDVQTDVNDAPSSLADRYDLKGRTALHEAARKGHLNVVNLLIDAGADIDAASPILWHTRTALQAAAEAGHLEVVNRLLDAGAYLNARPSRENGRSALQGAAENGHIEVVERLLEEDTDVNAAPAEHQGRTALQAAAENGHIEVMKRLLGKGADVNSAPAERQGRTALQAAAEGGHLDVVNRLLAVGAHVNAAPAEEDGRTALQAAAAGGYLEVANRLLDAGADVNAAPARREGLTALQAAAASGNLELVNRLLDADADVNADAPDDEKPTALRTAKKRGYADIEKRLKLAGAKR